MAWPSTVNLDSSRMSEDKIRYDVIVCEALRGVIRTVLQRVLKRGLPGENHFFITFDTTAPGTIISKRLKEQYPEEMMIVLQYQFWDLMVYDDRFEVKLSFNAVPERLIIPYSAIKNFRDPSAQFALNPNLSLPTSAGNPAIVADGSVERPDIVALPGPGISSESASEPAKQDVGKTEDPSGEPAQESAKVVELDLFRKK